jgi:hypothetical protein
VPKAVQHGDVAVISADDVALDTNGDYWDRRHYDPSLHHRMQPGKNVGAYRGVVIHFRHCQYLLHQIRAVHPHLFPGPARPEYSRQVAGVEVEDLGRVMTLLAVVKAKERDERRKSASDGSMTFWENADPNGRRKGITQKVAPVPPLFKFDRGPPPPQAKDIEQQQMATKMNRFLQRLAKHPEFMAVPDPAISEESMTKLQAITNAIGVSLQGRKKKNKSGGKPYALKSLAAIDPAVFDQVMKDLYSGLIIIHDRDEEQARADMLKDGDRAELHTMSQLGSLHAEISNREGDGSVREIQNLENSETDAERRTAVGDTLLAQFVAQWGVSEKDVHDHTIESAVDLVKSKMLKASF